MLTYELKKKPGVPLYEALYRCIRQDILTGKLQPGEKLPSKRALFNYCINVFFTGFDITCFYHDTHQRLCSAFTD